ncbi:hypothetical protein DPEC_G00052450 [Dallia pectoralis]|uniref:Uncharacterized protein n=1 Tax=Dallia pectoralis TaxID=75939 RepID=A0ACC2HBK4_DALPE|nr:hypothetical protein DPEC_G00052450 [Dallia pectoralis]
MVGGLGRRPRPLGLVPGRAYAVAAGPGPDGPNKHRRERTAFPHRQRDRCPAANSNQQTEVSRHILTELWAVWVGGGGVWGLGVRPLDPLIAPGEAHPVPWEVPYCPPTPLEAQVNRRVSEVGCHLGGGRRDRGEETRVFHHDVT